MAEANCDVYETVDFGQGPVKVRCTAIGSHTQHKCEVVFLQPSESEVQHKNVFEKDSDG